MLYIYRLKIHCYLFSFSRKTCAIYRLSLLISHHEHVIALLRYRSDLLAWPFHFLIEIYCIKFGVPLNGFESLWITLRPLMAWRPWMAIDGLAMFHFMARCPLAWHRIVQHCHIPIPNYISVSYGLFKYDRQIINKPHFVIKKNLPINWGRI